MPKRKPSRTRADRVYVPATITVRARSEAGDRPDASDRFRISGVAGVVDQPTLIREIVDGKMATFEERFAPGAFRSVLNQDVVCLVNHDDNLVLGRVASGTLRLSETESGDLAFELDPPDVSYARDLETLLVRNDMGGCSIGFLVEPGGEEWSADKRSVIVRKVAALRDVSIVTKPAYRGTSVALRRSYAAPHFRAVALAAARKARIGRELDDLRKRIGST